jgi:hypothetical protein
MIRYPLLVLSGFVANRGIHGKSELLAFVPI